LQFTSRQSDNHVSTLGRAPFLSSAIMAACCTERTERMEPRAESFLAVSCAIVPDIESWKRDRMAPSRGLGPAPMMRPSTVSFSDAVPERCAGVG
jgi:hypothetical protein